MIEYVENLLGIDLGYLANSDFGIMLVMVLAVILILLVFRSVLIWFDKIFQR